MLRKNLIASLRVIVALSTSIAATTFIIRHRLTIPPEILGASWGLFIVMAFVGLGTAANQVFFRGTRVDWGLRGAWGFSVALLLGGAMLCLHLAKGGVLIGLVAVGVAFFVHDLLRKVGGRMPRLDEAIGFHLGLGVLLVLGILLMLGSYANVGEWSYVDDPPAYQAFPKEIVQTGTLFQPFSLRRISSYCGASFLQAMVFAGSSIDSLYVFDRGICAILVLGLVAGHPRRGSPLPRALLLLPALVMLMLPDERANLGSVLSGAVPLLGAYRTLLVMPIDSEVRVPRWMLLALVVAAAITLRPFYLIPSVGLVIASQTLDLINRPQDWKRIARECSWFAGALVVSLLPWAVLQFIDCGTPLFPMFKGNLRPGSGFIRVEPSFFHLLQLWDGSTLLDTFATTHLMAIAGLCVADRSPRRTMRAFYIASLVGFVVLIATLPRAPSEHLVRYRFSLEVGFVMVIAAFALTDPRPSNPRSAAAIAIVLFSLCFEFYDLRRTAHSTFLNIVEHLKPTPDKHLTVHDAEGRSPEYTSLQAAVPRGATLATMIDEPYRFDFARNRIALFDIPGQVSPKPGFPFFAGPDALARYLLNQSIGYLACTKADRSSHLYKASTWRWHASHPAGSLGADMAQHYEAPFVLDIMDSVDKLVASRKHVYEDDSKVVVDLAALP